MAGAGTIRRLGWVGLRAEPEDEGENASFAQVSTYIASCDARFTACTRHRRSFQTTLRDGRRAHDPVLRNFRNDSPVSRTVSSGAILFATNRVKSCNAACNFGKKCRKLTCSRESRRARLIAGDHTKTSVRKCSPAEYLAKGWSIKVGKSLRTHG